MDTTVKAVVWYSAVLLLKLASFPLIIGVNRVRRGVFVAEEDARFFGGVVKFTDVWIERLRR